MLGMATQVVPERTRLWIPIRGHRDRLFRGEDRARRRVTGHSFGEDRDAQDIYVLRTVLDRMGMIDIGDKYGYFQMGEEFNSVSHDIECEEWCEFGWGYTNIFKRRFELLKSVSDLIMEHILR